MSNQTTANQQPRTEAQTNASRTNGSKSLGPVTVEGKAKVKSNRLAHGFRATTVPLATEDRAAYATHHDAYIARYNPIDKVEHDLVGLLATNMWQVMRMTSIEVALFDIEICGIEDELRRDWVGMDEWGRLALAFKKSAGDNALELLRRYKSTAERAYHRALQAIEDIHRNRPIPHPNVEEINSTVQTQQADTSLDSNDNAPPSQPAHTGNPLPFLIPSRRDADPAVDQLEATAQIEPVPEPNPKS